MISRPLILASTSPRRKQLLEEAGFTFKVKGINTDESYPSTLPPSKIAEYIAEQKAVAAEQLILSDEIIITADTIVAIEASILGKPKDKAEAKIMLTQLSGKTHQVITGVCLTSKEKKELFSCSTEVTFKELSDEELHYYIEEYQPYDKAGAYATQEWIGMIGIQSMKGCYYNVVGLPINALYQRLLVF